MSSPQALNIIFQYTYISSFLYLITIFSTLLSFMASNGILPNQITIELPIHSNEPKQIQGVDHDESNNIDYTQRAQWLRAAMLGANDGLVTVASMMIGIGAVKEDISVMLLAGFAGLIAGACSMAIGEFVSVYTQYDIEMAQIKRNRETNTGEVSEMEKLPNPFQAALASAVAFTVGAMMPLLSAAFIRDHKIRMAVIAAVVSFALLIFGGAGAVLGKTPVMRSCFRVVIAGWMAMAITFGITKWVGTAGVL